MASTNRELDIVIERWNKNIPVIWFTDTSEVCKSLRDTLNAASPELSRVVPSHLLLYCDICANGDFKYALTILKDIFNKNHDEVCDNVKNHEVLTSECIFNALYKSNYPVIDNLNIKRVYDKIWDEQLDSVADTGNMSYWANFITS